MEAEVATKLWVASFIREIQFMLETKVVSHQERVAAQIEEIQENLKNEVSDLRMKLNLKTAESESDTRLQVEVKELRKTVLESSEEARIDFNKLVSELDALKQSVAEQLRASEDRMLRASEDRMREKAALTDSDGELSAPEQTGGEDYKKDTGPQRTISGATSTTHFTLDTGTAVVITKTAQTEIVNDFYKLEDSVFDCALCVFSKMIYLEDSIAILFGVFASVVIQITLLWLIAEIEIEDPLLWQAQAWYWRLNNAHDKQHLDAQHVSLARALCDPRSMPFSPSPQLLLYDIELYTQPFLGIELFPQGISMVMVVLVIWICDAVREIVDSFRMILAFGSLKIDRRSGMTLHQRPNSELFHLSAIGLWRKVWAAALCLTRLFVGMFLCLTGCRLLVQTINIEELLFNAISLTFIVEIDESIAYLLVTDEVKWIIQRMDPLAGPGFISKNRRCTHFMVPGFAILLGGSLWFVFMFAFVRPYLDNLHDVRDLLCGGLKDFVFQINETSGLVQIEATTAGYADFSLELLATVQEATGVTPPDDYD